MIVKLQFLLIAVSLSFPTIHDEFDQGYYDIIDHSEALYNYLNGNFYEDQEDYFDQDINERVAYFQASNGRVSRASPASPASLASSYIPPSSARAAPSGGKPTKPPPVAIHPLSPGAVPAAPVSKPATAVPKPPTTPKTRAMTPEEERALLNPSGGRERAANTRGRSGAIDYSDKTRDPLAHLQSGGSLFGAERSLQSALGGGFKGGAHALAVKAGEHVREDPLGALSTGLAGAAGVATLSGAGAPVGLTLGGLSLAAKFGSKVHQRSKQKAAEAKAAEATAVGNAAASKPKPATTAATAMGAGAFAIGTAQYGTDLAAHFTGHAAGAGAMLASGIGAGAQAIPLVGTAVSGALTVGALAHQHYTDEAATARDIARSAVGIRAENARFGSKANRILGNAFADQHASQGLFSFSFTVSVFLPALTIHLFSPKGYTTRESNIVQNLHASGMSSEGLLPTGPVHSMPAAPAPAPSRLLEKAQAIRDRRERGEKLREGSKGHANLVRHGILSPAEGRSESDLFAGAPLPSFDQDLDGDELFDFFDEDDDEDFE